MPPRLKTAKPQEFGTYAKFSANNRREHCIQPEDIELIAERFNLVMDSVQWILFHGLEKRLAVFLVAEYDRHGKTHIHLTHDYIARYIGTSRERVTKTLKKLNDKKLIYKSKGCVELTDIDGLRALASLPYCSDKLP